MLVKLPADTKRNVPTPPISNDTLSADCTMVEEFPSGNTHVRTSMINFGHWKYISSKSFSAGLVYAVKRELLDCILATPLLHTNLRAGVSEYITASDASQVGGAVGIARELTPVGADFFKSSITGSHGLKRIPCVIISLFNGIGGAFRAYDLLGLVPLALISFEIHPPANRVVSRRWPHAILLGDVKELDASTIRAWLIEYPEVEEFHLWAGFPCGSFFSKG